MRRLVIVLLFLTFIVDHSKGQFRGYCSLAQEPLVTIGKDSQTGRYYVIPHDQEDDGRTPPGERRSLYSSLLTTTTTTREEVSPQLLLRGSFFEDDDNSALLVDQRNNSSSSNKALLVDKEESIPSVVEEDTDTSVFVQRYLINNKTDDDDDDSLVLLKVRRCHCATNVNNYYCPIDKLYCGIPRYNRDSQIPGCVNRNKQQVFVRSIWIYLVVWFAIVISILLCTPWGRMALLSLPGLCLCGQWYRELLADVMLRYQPDRATLLVRRNLYRRRRILERRYRRITGERLPVATPVLENEDDDINNNGDETTITTTVNVVFSVATVKPPKSLALRTRRYERQVLERPRHDENADEDDSVGDLDDDDDDETTCTICFAPLEDGDRIGDLPCNHCFHAECLKQWLRRRNACPLCQEDNVAIPQYDEDDDDDDEIVAPNDNNEEANTSRIESTDTVETAE